MADGDALTWVSGAWVAQKAERMPNVKIEADICSAREEWKPAKMQGGAVPPEAEFNYQEWLRTPNRSTGNPANYGLVTATQAKSATSNPSQQDFGDLFELIRSLLREHAKQADDMKSMADTITSMSGKILYLLIQVTALKEQLCPTPATKGELVLKAIGENDTRRRKIW